MRAPLKPVRDPSLAGEFARKCLGKFAYARIRSVRAPRIGRTYDVYEIGTCNQTGDFVVRGDSAHDFAEAFDRAGHPMDARDPLFLRDDLRYVNEICEANEAEQVEMAL
ncbi:MAG: hypothetical protein ACLFS4_06760 [Opitutales bacterium]